MIIIKESLNETNSQRSFETNSSSTHSITMCSGEDFDKWQNGEMFYVSESYGSESEFAKLDWVTIEQARDILAKNKYYEGVDPAKLNEEELFEAIRETDMRITTYDDYGHDYLEYFEDEFTTPSGERVVAFGEYGRD